MSDLNPALIPSKTVLEGTYCRLEPLNVEHAEDLFAAINDNQIQARHQYLFETPPISAHELKSWIASTMANSDFMYFAVIDKKTNKCGGRQALMRIQPEHCVIELGSILWGKGIAKTCLATEALYLTAKHIFEELGYRRFEWKCNNLNAASKRAAIRFGFEFDGIFRQHMIIKGQNRDTAWFSILDSEWPKLSEYYRTWLNPNNFDAGGRQKKSLSIPPQPEPLE